MSVTRKRLRSELDAERTTTAYLREVAMLTSMATVKAHGVMCACEACRVACRYLGLRRERIQLELREVAP